MSGFKTFQGRRNKIGPATKQPVPIPLDPVANEGAWVYGEDGAHWYSNGVEWISARDLIAQLREPVILDPDEGEVTADVRPQIRCTPFAPLYEVDLGSIIRRFQIQEAGGDWSNPVINATSSNKDYTLQQDLGFLTQYEVRVQDEIPGGYRSNWSDTVTFSTPNNIVRPVNSFPADGAVDVALTTDLVANSFQTSVYAENHIGTEFEIYEAGGETPIHTSGVLTGGTQAYEIPEGVLADDGRDYEWRVRYQGDVTGWSEWSLRTGFTSIRVRIAQPDNVLPAPGETNVSVDSLTLQSSVFEVIGDTDVHVESEWAVYDSGGTLVYTSGPTSSDLESHTVPAGSFPGNQEYTFTVRHAGQNLGWSDWSVPTAFTPYEPYIETPTAEAPIGGATVAEDEILLDATPFNALFGTDTHQYSQFIVRNKLTKTVVVDTGETYNTTLTSYSVDKANVERGETYEWQVRYKGQQFGWSGYSAWAEFAVAVPTIEKPSNVTPADGATDVRMDTLTLEASAFNVLNGVDFHDASQWRIYRSSDDTLLWDSGTDSVNLTSVPVPQNPLTDNEPVYWQVRYLGNTVDWSPWSDPTSFTPREYKVVKPTAQAPAGASSVDIFSGGIVTLQGSPFQTQPTSDSHAASEFRVLNLDTGVTDLQVSTGGQTSYTVPDDGTLQTGVNYEWQVRYQGTDFGWSEWSDSTAFTLAAAPTRNIYVRYEDDTVAVLDEVSLTEITAATALPAVGTMLFGTNGQVYATGPKTNGSVPLYRLNPTTLAQEAAAPAMGASYHLHYPYYYSNWRQAAAEVMPNGDVVALTEWDGSNNQQILFYDPDTLALKNTLSGINDGTRVIMHIAVGADGELYVIACTNPSYSFGRYNASNYELLRLDTATNTYTSLWSDATFDNFTAPTEHGNYVVTPDNRLWFEGRADGATWGLHSIDLATGSFLTHHTESDGARPFDRVRHMIPSPLGETYAMAQDPGQSTYAVFRLDLSDLNNITQVARHTADNNGRALMFPYGSASAPLRAFWNSGTAERLKDLDPITLDYRDLLALPDSAGGSAPFWVGQGGPSIYPIRVGGPIEPA